MKKLLLFVMMSIALIGQENEGTVKEATVDVIAQVIKPIQVADTKNVDFGTIVVGQENVETSNSGDGYIIFSGDKKIEVTWRNEDGQKFNPLKNPLTVTMTNKTENSGTNNEIKALIKAEAEGVESGVIDLNGGNKTIKFKGSIGKVPEVSSGNYSGKFTVRAEYVD